MKMGGWGGGSRRFGEGVSEILICVNIFLYFNTLLQFKMEIITGKNIKIVE